MGRGGSSRCCHLGMRVLIVIRVVEPCWLSAVTEVLVGEDVRPLEHSD